MSSLTMMNTGTRTGVAAGGVTATGAGVVLPRAKISDEAMARAPLIPGVTTNVKKESVEGTKGKKGSG